ncbi:hypothetical protein KCU77_g3711, partial [Aureobasidium melanogenum]
MPASQVLSSPELVSLILQCFEEQTCEEHYFENRLTRFTLAEAARVNHIWFEAATRVLWSYQQIWGPSLEDLNNIESSRRQKEESYDPIILESSADDDLQKMLPGLPRLQRLEWLLETDISIDTLKTLSTHCSELSLANFLGSWDLVALTDVPGCLFPELRDLTLYKPHVKTHRGSVPAKRCGLQILRHAPKLEKLDFVEKPQSNVLLAWSKLKKAKRQFSESSFERLVWRLMNEG